SVRSWTERRARTSARCATASSPPRSTPTGADAWRPQRVEQGGTNPPQGAWAAHGRRASALAALVVGGVGEDAARDRVRVGLAAVLGLHDGGLVGVAHLAQLEHDRRAPREVEGRE